ncbi:uncharacterized protein F5147DRAFT_747387 [Suillus discolor]|uniref:Uncharacterized protein n=1 Tax=Suillus discolor TaxID=1912936 RepID=A0A9P7EZ47_9AGAM|nr:uncharacterized protein F5147DRAFT_747387 [Suillus discolor]KAG2098243.1 hypothetical protein F5147DRAFT_747387 [Suillus discolor]
MKDWTSPVYAFFDSTPIIETLHGHCAHAFKCMGKRCKHIKTCWGNEVLQAACKAKDADEVRTKIIAGILRNGSITSSFEHKGKGKVTYLHRQHTHTKTKAELVHWVAESLRPFDIVKDRGFQSLMKTGRPEYYIPSPRTISSDVKLVFVRTHE